MYRTKMNELKKWKNTEDRKPLIFYGARQVGKTYLLQKFGNQEYKQVVYINFERVEKMRSLFLQDLDPQRIITNFEFYAGFKITAENTLIILDEIQAAPKGISSLKYFQEEVPEYQIIAAGSLLGINMHPGESFPVGKVDTLTLYPMSFYEFLLAMGEENGLCRILREKHFESLNIFAEKFKEYLKYYFYIGGMPEAVAAFAKNRDWKKSRQIQNKILKNYRNDFSKHAPKDILPRINMVWDSIPTQLSKENKKFIYGVIRKGSRAKDFELAIQWLTDAGLLHKIHSVSKPVLPLISYQELSIFKLYHNDLGLLAAMSKLKIQTLVESNQVFEEFKGALTEQFVFQQLKLNEEFSINYYPFDSGRYELDFLIENEDGELIPIEVKAGENLQAISFKNYCQRYKPDKAIRTSLADYREETWMTNLPLYAINMLTE
ncbi:MAG: ATP-binding protein [Bacteroidales bacterium]|jgi:predicted AAA+ superfamily ATPase|nr:ATP-binding protein [Bacteroidales bacterium]MCK9498622.1 ATP-binding protein [Bacteroidales bacterium]MDY0315622.1 ATP-binding protein [Bacteroidales bacterium]NLB86242.1 ATP-binding protein [Bacteroidales bacterium]